MIIKFCVGGGSRSVHDQQVHTRREEQRCSSCNPNPYTSLEVVNTLTVISKKGIHHQERRKCLGSAFPHSDGSVTVCHTRVGPV